MSGHKINNMVWIGQISFRFEVDVPAHVSKISNNESGSAVEASNK